MRLLDLRGSDSGNTSPAPMTREPVVKPVLRPHRLAKPLTGQSAPATARVFPINSRPKTPARRPVDLAQLQQRIEELEKRIQQRLAKQADTARAEDVEQLRQRIRQLERRVETELWTARQREHTLLELLTRPALATRLRQQGESLLRAAPPAIWRGCKSFCKAWWQDVQPLWWPRFAAAWQQAWDSAQR